MRINEQQALLTPEILLVPYSEHHVITYHEWMQDPELQALTASEPLTLPEEYAMQKSWRTDADKLTFIVCAAPATLDPSVSTITAGKEDAPESMIGDVNLFLTPADDDKEHDPNQQVTDPASQSVIGEIEIMVASKKHRGRGLGKQILKAFVWYILQSLEGILSEYQSVHAVDPSKLSLRYLRVKIDKDNVRSIRLFEGLGFIRTTEQPNYFGELELRWDTREKSLEEKQCRLGDVVKRLTFIP